jgi:glycerol-3-phosphate O-acyltransferase
LQGTGTNTVYLVDATTRLERRLIEDWIAERRNGDGDSRCAVLPIPPSRGRSRPPIDDRLEAALATEADPLLAPLRVAWFPRTVDGVRAARVSDLWTFGDPRDPGSLRQAWIVRNSPERFRVVEAEPATLSDLRRRWRDASGSDVGHTIGLAEFVARQAALALERAERRLRGARYKVPRFVREDILSRPVFRGGVADLAAATGRSPEAVQRDAARYLDELAAVHSPYTIDLAAQLIRVLYTRAYNEDIRYDRAQLEEIFALGQRYPLVFLPTHKSNFDHPVLQYILYETGHPPNHTAGGINMNFFPIGPLLRRSGIFFIRRTFKNNPVYKFVLQQYIDYLVEKRFSLEWYLEGGRSRSGKLLPPRFGLFANVADAYRRGRSEDIYLIPVSIAYEQIGDIGDYVAEQRGAEKEVESFGWLVAFIRRLRRRHGDIHVRFGTPLSLREALGPPPPGVASDADEKNVGVQKIAFETAVRINRVTPITPTSLVTMALLGYGDRALTLDEVCASLEDLVHYASTRNLPATVPLDSICRELIQSTLDMLVDSGVVTVFTEGPQSVYAIGPDQHLAAAYYRNTISHFFVNASIAELALVRAAEPGVDDPVSEFWAATRRLRDLLKFEFFFADRDAYERDLRAEVALHDAEWETRIAGGANDVLDTVLRIRPYSAHRVLRPFLEAYRVVTDILESGDVAPADDRGFMQACLALGKQYRLQKRIRSAESISKALFATALKLAANRGLLGEDESIVGDRRRQLAGEIRDAIRFIDAIESLASGRQAGLLR